MSTAGRGKVQPRNRNTRRVPRNRVKPNYALLFTLFAVSGLFTGMFAYALRTPALAVKKIKIEGARLCNRSALQAAANLAVGQNILLLRKSPILREIRTLSEVSDVQMGRVFPNGVWIRVIERRPDAVMLSGHRFCMMQADGLMFHKTAGPIRGLPLIIASGSDPIKPGKRTCSAGVRYALEAVACARREALKLDKISVDPRGDICLNMGDGFYVRLGQPDDTARKMTLLRRALVYRPSIAREAVYVDLSCPSAPVWKPKMVAQAAS